MNPAKFTAKKAAINRFKNEALAFEQGQYWKQAAIRWEHCAKIAQQNEDKGFFSYSAFFCYRRAKDIPKADAMIKQCRNKYILIGDKISAALCTTELEALNA